MTVSQFPGNDLVERGLRELSDGIESIPSLLVSIGAPRLRRLGIAVPHPFWSPEARLYALLRRSGEDSAHGRYNALVRRLVSYERAAGGIRDVSDRDRIDRFMRALGAETTEDIRVYFTGGATAVLYGWRDSIIDVDIIVVPERDPVLRALSATTENAKINIKLASPPDFVPVPTGWEDRSPFIRQERRAFFHHFDLYAQALAKIERGHAQDLEDVRAMLARGLIDRARGLEYLAAAEPFLYRYPAVDARTLRAAVADILRASPD